MYRPNTIRCMLDRHGAQVTLRVNSTAGTYNPATGSITGGSTTDYTVMAHPSDYTLQEMVASDVVIGMRKYLLSTLDVNGQTIPEPEVDDLIIGLGDTVSITRVQTIYSSGPVCYICHVKE